VGGGRVKERVFFFVNKKEAKKTLLVLGLWRFKHRAKRSKVFFGSFLFTKKNILPPFSNFACPPPGNGLKPAAWRQTGPLDLGNFPKRAGPKTAPERLGGRVGGGVW
jgi:hypothetical protein